MEIKTVLLESMTTSPRVTHSQINLLSGRTMEKKSVLIRLNQGSIFSSGHSLNLIANPLPS
jgi:hypothetical protein